MKLLGSAAIAALALGISSPASLAMDFGNGFSIIGEVELEYITGNGNSELFGHTDLTLGWRSGGMFGLDLAIVRYHDITDSSDESAIWGGLVMSTSFGDVTIGRPRPVLANFSPAHDPGAIKLFSTGEFGLISGSFVDLVAMFGSDLDVYGVTLKGDSGAFSYGAGIHSLRDGGQSLEVIEVTGKYTTDTAEVYGALETTTNGLQDYRKYMIGGRYMQDSWSLGVEVANVSLLMPGDVTVTKLYGDYKVADGLTLGIQYQNWDDLGDDFIGVSGVYNFGIGGFAELGYVVDSDGDNIGSASIGFRF